MDACTIIARNYLAHARVLAHSFAAHHPGGTFNVLLLDDLDREIEEAREPFRILTPFEIGLDTDEFHRMAMIYDVVELATAVKPWFLRTLLAEGAEAVSYFDPDIHIYAPLNDLSELAIEHGIVLIPHMLEPMPRDDRVPSETTILEAGIYNLGFIAVSGQADDFLDWWSERLARDCYLSPQESRFVDQRWIDFVPGLFGNYILRDPGADVAHWNLWSRNLEWTGERYEVDGRPLRFYHFSGFDPNRPYLLSKHQGTRPRILLSERPALARLCKDYARELLAAGYLEWTGKGYAYDELAGGFQVDGRLRRLYRRALVEAENERSALPPDPFDPGKTQEFLEWVKEPADSVGGAVAVSRYLSALYSERSDLQGAFPNLRWGDASSYLAWAATDGRRQEQIPAEFLPSQIPAPSSNGSSAPEGLRHGINVAGYFRAELGIGEAARQLVSGIKVAGIPFSTVTYASGTSSRQEHPFEGAGTSEPVYDTNFICVNADRLLPFASDMGPDFFRGRYSVGVWWWEVPRFPPAMHAAFEVIDEIWVGSEYISQTIAAETEKPVHVVPIPVTVPDEKPASRAELGLPDKYMFLFSFDFFSVFERKNPLGLVQAFVRAFRPGEGPVLVLKSINGNKQGVQLEELRAAAAERPDILVIDKYFSAHDKNSIMATCDCYVSLHRSEGFGLTMAEAMAYGKPVIATGYSGNLAFMDNDNSYLVSYKAGRIPPGCEPYPAGVEWAEPDLEQAAELMRHVYEHRQESDDRGRRARIDILERCSPARTAEFVTRRMGEIRHERALRPEREVPNRLFARKGPPLARASALVARGPAGMATPSSRFGAPVALLRRFFGRVLAPYVNDQHMLSKAVVESLEALQEGQKLQADQLWRVDEDVKSGRVRVEQSVSDLWLRLEVIEKSLHETRVGLQDLSGQLVTPPYMADPSLLQTRDERGRPAIGFTGGGGVPSVDVYRGFEEIFRGAEPFIRERQRIYLDVVGARGPVLDVGCGRGEFLELLREARIDSKGIDLDVGMVEHCREKGLDVEQANALDHLERLPDASLGAIFSAQVIEHLGYDDLLRYLALSAQKLQPNGVFVAETVNPHSIRAYKMFWLDPTHQTPIFPEVAVALCRLSGYASAFVMFPNGAGELERDRVEEGEYAVVARAPSA